MDDQELMVFGGSGSPRLTARICEYLQIEPGRNDTLRFSDGNTFVRILENVRGREIYLVQGTVFPSNDNFMELLFWLDAFKRSGADSVTAVVPYFSYAKGDKKDEPRVSIRARVCADAIEIAGANRVITMDLHSPQIQGFFRIPVDNLYGLPALCEHIQAQGFENAVVVSPDAGFVKQARKYATWLGLPVAIATKERLGYDETARVQELVGQVAGRTALIVDDFTASGSTLVEVAGHLAAHGARDIYAAVTHGVFTPGSIERLDASPIRRLFVTDTVENQPVQLSDKIDIVSVAPLFGEAIRRSHNRESLGEMFAM